MLIVLDIGNTAVTYGIAEKDALKSSGSALFNDIPDFLKKCSRSGNKKDINIVISSVVPENTSKLIDFISKKKGFRVFLVGQDLKINIPMRYHPKQLGIDRLVNAYGGLRFYKAPLLLIDYGTAITFDYVSKKGVFEGGMIVPGPELSFQALIQKAAKLPKDARLPLKSPSFLGNNTLDCLKSGILEGYGAMTDDLVRRFKSKFTSHLKVVATGGFAKHLKPYSKLIGKLDPLLSVRSLIELAKESNIQ